MANPRGRGRGGERRESAAPAPSAPEPGASLAEEQLAPATGEPRVGIEVAFGQTGVLVDPAPTCHCGAALSVYSGSNEAKVGTALCDGGRGGCGCRYLVETGQHDPRHPACRAAAL